MKRIVSALVLFSLALFLQAQSRTLADVFNYPLSPETTDAFLTTFSSLGEHPFVRGVFEQEKTLSRLGRSLKSSGNFLIAADLGMVWDTVSPFPSTLTLGKDYLVQSRPGGQRTILSAQGNETFIRLADVISTLFSGHSRGLLDNFAVFFIDGAVWELGLTPIDRAIGTFAERIIMTGDRAIRTIEIHEQNGDTTYYVLRNHSYPTELNVNESALFTVP